MKNKLNLIETERLFMKPLTLNNFEEMRLLSSDPEIMRYITGRAETPEETKKKLERLVLHYEKHGFGFCSVYEKISGEFIGRAGLIYLELNDQQPDIEIGYTLGKKFWNRGYATELVNALINWGLKNLAVKRLVALIDPENTESRHVAEKCGLQYLGLAHHWDSKVAFYAIKAVN